MSDLMIGVIGGSGLGQALTGGGSGKLHEVSTPFGQPSGPIKRTQWEGAELAVLSRHGPGHTINPSAVPYRANIYALKSLGVTHIIASGAVGSLREQMHPRHLVIPDQVIDKTFGRRSTFFDSGLVAHVEFAEPFCPTLRRALLAGGDQVETSVHDGGTYVCMEGPQFSTRSESAMHRQWGGDLIGMTCLPEAKLAREAEICYALVALATDYDCWRPHAPATSKQDLLSEIIGNLQAATDNALKLIRATIRRLANDPPPPCACQDALEMAIWTDKSAIDPAVAQRLGPLVSKRLG
jgi:5'-methylthioadenosine phosphorylase